MQSSNNDPQFSEARRLYAEQFGDAIVSSYRLWLVVIALTLVTVSLIWLNYNTVNALKTFKPLIVRIDQIGRAEAVNYNAFSYKPQEAEIKYFLSEFSKLYYSRNRFTIVSNFKKALYFTEQNFGTTLEQSYRKNRVIQNYLENPVSPDIEISIQKIAIQDLRQAPYKATVDFYQIYLNPVDRTEIKRVLYTANYVFSFRDNVPNDLVQTNPLGMAIQYFREDESFTAQ